MDDDRDDVDDPAVPDPSKSPISFLLSKLETMLMDCRYYGIRPGVAKYIRAAHNMIGFLGPQNIAAQKILHHVQSALFTQSHALAVLLTTPPSPDGVQDPRVHAIVQAFAALEPKTEVVGFQNIRNPDSTVIHGHIVVNNPDDPAILIFAMNDPEGKKAHRILKTQIGLGPDQWIFIPIMNKIAVTGNL